MHPTHHPPEELLAAYAAGTLEEAEQLVVGVHVSGCRICGRLVRAFEELAGNSLETIRPVTLAEGAFAAVLACIENAGEEKARPRQQSTGEDSNAHLPEALRHYEIGKRRRVAPGLGLRPIILKTGGKSRAFLLEASPGSRMLEHSHDGKELTCVLQGSFTHESGRFVPGDFDYGDEDVSHRPVVDDNGLCICLVAMQGDLRLSGLLGKIVSPFVRL